MRLFADAAAHASALHEVRVAAATFTALGVDCYAPHLALGGKIPCWAAPEATVLVGRVVVPGWMLEALGLTVGSEVVLERRDCASAPLLELRVVAEPRQRPDGGTVTVQSSSAAVPAGATDGEGVAASASGGGAALAPLPASSTASAICRQLRDLPLSVGSYVAIRHLSGVVRLRVCGVLPCAGAGEQLAAVVDANTRVVLLCDDPTGQPALAHQATTRDEADVAAPSVGGASAHWGGSGLETSVLERIWAHVEPRLPPASSAAGAGEDDVARSMRSVAAQGGHVLLTGPAGVGKAEAIRAVCRRAETQGAVVLSLSCLRLIGETKELETALSEAFACVLPPMTPAEEEVCLAAPPSSFVSVPAQPVAPPPPSPPPSEVAAEATAARVGAGATEPPLYVLHLLHLEALCVSEVSLSESPVDETVRHAARRLVTKLRDAQARPLLCLGSVRDARRLPPLLLSHGAFLFSLFLGPPPAEQRAAMLRKLLLGDAKDEVADAGDEALASLVGELSLSGAGGAAVPLEAVGGDSSGLDALVHRLSRQTAGLGPRELRRLVMTARLFGASRTLLSRDAPPVVAESLLPSWEDAARALARVAAGAEAGGEAFGAGLPPSSAPDVGGYASLCECLHRLITWPIERKADYAQLGIAPPGGALLFGPPGNGKTLLAHAAAASGCTVLRAKGPALFGEYVGDTEAAIRELFRQARECAPSLIVLDEIDALGAKRGGGEGSQVARRALSAMLNELDGLGGRAGVFLLGCTNQPEAIDAALLRPGRLDELLLVPFPSEADRRGVLRVHCAPLRLAHDVSLESLARRTERFSCAALAALCREAAVVMLSRSLSGARRGGGEDRGLVGDDEDEDDDEEEEEEPGRRSLSSGAADAPGIGSSPSKQLEVSAVCASDFEAALRVVCAAQVLPPDGFEALERRYADFLQRL